METPVTFQCENEQLLGIFSDALSETAVLVVVGGPQYRVGSHRQFTLLCRHLADAGISSLRFDYRGMGDSSGSIRDFESVQLDIEAAIDQLFALSPSIKRVVLWGLCDAASANLFYAYTDERVCGVVMLNPWVRTVEGEAKAYLKHYYLSRLLDKELWKKILLGKFDFKQSFLSLSQMVMKLLVPQKEIEGAAKPTCQQNEISGTLPERMLKGLEYFNGDVLLILSGNDLTADEFRDVVASSPEWRQVLASDKVSEHTLKQANHTFSTAAWRGEVEKWTSDWVLSINDKHQKS